MIRRRIAEAPAPPREAAGGPDGDSAADAPAEAASAPPAGTAAPPPTVTLRSALETVGIVAAPATVLTGLMFYFGWLRARTLALGIGIHPDVLGYATQDFLISSIDALFWPVAFLALLVLVFLWLHVRISARVIVPGRADLLGRLAAGVAIAGVLLLAGSGVAAFRPAGVELAGFRITYAGWAPPLGIVLAVVLLDYGVLLRRRLSALRVPGQAVTPRTAWATASQRGVLGALVLLALFWAVTVYAQDVGAVALANLQRDSEWRELPAVVLYSPQDLQLAAPGVVAGRCPAADAAYRFRYTGLRLFAYSNDKYFLLPVAWPDTGGPAIVLPDDPTLRVELLPGRLAPDPDGLCPPEG